MSSECNHPYDLTNNYEGVCFGCNRHLSDIVEELAELRGLQDKLEEVYPVVAAHIKRLLPEEGK